MIGKIVVEQFKYLMHSMSAISVIFLTYISSCNTCILSWVYAIKIFRSKYNVIDAIFLSRGGLGLNTFTHFIEMADPRQESEGS
jgi:hypothetical protein